MVTRRVGRSLGLLDVIGRVPLPHGIASAGVIAIGRGVRLAEAVRITDALLEGGVRAFEITLNQPEEAALETIDHLRSRFLGQMNIGAGTVLSVWWAKRAIDSGAEFLVMPNMDPDIIRWAAAQSVATIPGALTPTEILSAWKAGASAIKLFPASSVGEGFLHELRGPLPAIPLVPTGGVDADRAAAYIKAGAVAVGVGGWLLGDHNRHGVSERARNLVDAIRLARANSHGSSAG